MWISAELPDNFSMRMGKIQKALKNFLVMVRHLFAKGGKKCDAPILIGNILGVFQRQVGKHSFYRPKFLIQPPGQHLIAPVMRVVILGKRPRITAEDIPAELVAQDNQGQQSSGRGFPVHQIASAGGHESCLIGLGNFLVNFRIYRPPHRPLLSCNIGIVFLFSKPEAQYVVCSDTHRRLFYWRVWHTYWISATLPLTGNNSSGCSR